MARKPVDRYPMRDASDEELREIVASMDRWHAMASREQLEAAAELGWRWREAAKALEAEGRDAAAEYLARGGGDRVGKS